MTNIKSTWKERYLLSLNETQSIKSIMVLFDCGRPKAIELRKVAMSIDANDNMVKFTKARTSYLLKALGYESNYFYKKMMDERRAESYAKD